MCGIVGYIGDRPLLPVLLEGLRRLEYRGYDSAGVVFLEEGELKICKVKGRVYDLEEKIFSSAITQAHSPGLGHTRWATHGEPSDENAHPHFDCERRLAVVHNGIIENYYTLREELIQRGHRFLSSTDTEVIVHLIEEHLRDGKRLFDAFLKSLERLKGAFAVALISKDEPDKIICARYQNPLIIGLGRGENFLASDIPALLPFTREVIPLEDQEIAVLTQDKVEVYDFSGRSKKRSSISINWDISQAEKAGFPHFMLKEIFEQPEVVKNTLLGRLNLEGKEVDLSKEGLSADLFEEAERVYIVACGTSYHAGLVGKYLLEQVLNVPIEVDYASEFRYRSPRINERTLFIGVSQSGETADTLASLRLAKSKGARILSICNVLGSSMTRESDFVVYTQAGPEISVASTKAFTAQVLIFILLKLYLQRLKNDSYDGVIFERLIELPASLKVFLEGCYPKIKEIARKWYQAKDFLYLGRGILFPLALEGALKLKEISYIHAEGYPAGEMKHGPIALIEESVPTVVLSARELGILYEKTLSNAEEVKSRRGPLIGIVSEDAREFCRICDDVIEVPLTLYELLPIFYVVPLQLLAYEIAVLRGCDVDRPRNLAKSVTVE